MIAFEFSRVKMIINKFTDWDKITNFYFSIDNHEEIFCEINGNQIQKTYMRNIYLSIQKFR
jgi:hypothetical protein